MGQRIVLIGAGSAQFGYGTIGDILQSSALAGSEIVLHDINPTTLATVERTGRAFLAEQGLPFTISATTDRAEALRGATFVIISIEVGSRFDLWDLDWRIPQQYGVTQVYGENGGAGGLFHALRVTPPILEICADIERICPEAFVFNYSNPMSRICTTVHRAFPRLRFIGLCHEIASLQRFLPIMLGVPYEELAVRAGGLNHFSVVLTARYRSSGLDAYPDIRARAPQVFGNMPSMRAVQAYRMQHGRWPESMEDYLQMEREAWPERRVFQVILEQFGLLPITSDSHFGEYITWAHEVTDHRGIVDFYRFYRAYLAQHEPKIELRLSERVVPIIEGIVGDTGYEEEAVNIPNAGLIDNLPSWIVVETPAVIGAEGARGVPLGTLPRGFAGLLLNQVAIHDMTAEAIIGRSRSAALQALLVDPVVGRFRGMDELLDTMIAYQKPWLDYLV